MFQQKNGENGPKDKPRPQSTREEEEPIQTVKTGGLRSLLTTKKTPTPQEQKAAIISTHSDLKDLDVKNAKKFFKELSKELVSEKRDSVAAFFADPLIKVENSTVFFTVGSKLILENIAEVEGRAIQYFNKQGYKLNAIKCEVNAAKIKDYKVFTPQQQFEVMVKKHPELQDFATRFNLEIDG